MAYRSEPDLVVLHAVRLKGFAEPSDVAEATGLDDGDASRRLAAFHHRDLVTRRDARPVPAVPPPTRRRAGAFRRRRPGRAGKALGSVVSRRVDGAARGLPRHARPESHLRRRLLNEMDVRSDRTYRLPVCPDRLWS